MDAKARKHVISAALEELRPVVMAMPFVKVFHYHIYEDGVVTEINITVEPLVPNCLYTETKHWKFHFEGQDDKELFKEIRYKYSRSVGPMLGDNYQFDDVARKKLHSMLPDIFSESGSIDVYALATRAQRSVRREDNK